MAKKAKKKANKKRKSKKCTGNFRRPTPATAKKYIAYWERKKDEFGNTIVDPKQIKLSDPKQTELGRIHLSEALHVWNDYNRRLAEYDAAKAEWASLKKSGMDPAKSGLKKPAKPSMTNKASNKCQKGSFRQRSKAGAAKYLSRLLRHTKKDLTALDFSTQRAAAVTMHSKDMSYKQYQHAPRVAEALVLLGNIEAMKILKSAQKFRANAQKKAAEKAVKKAEAAVKRKEKKKEKLDLQIKNIKANKVKYLKAKSLEIKKLQKQISTLSAVAIAARRKRARARKKSRRRNPIRKRKNKKVTCKRKIKRRKKS